MTLTTEDAFLGGRLTLRQPKHGYRSGADPVFLAAAVPASSGQSVLELGCGAGAALFCLMARVPGLDATGVERDRAAADLARGNADANGLPADIVTADIAGLPDTLRAQSFDHVFANPPFFDRTQGSRADGSREAGRGEETPLSLWVDTAIRRLKPGGTLTLIQRADRLPDCLSALDDRIGDTLVLPLAARRGRSAKLMILHAKKGAKGPFRLAAPLVLHDGDRHEKDGDSYSTMARAILRDGAPLTLSAFIHS